MSTAKMVADSTVSSTLPGDRRKRRKSATNKHNKRTRKHSKDDGKGHHSEYSDSDLDLEKDLKAIGEYIKDRTEMLDNMFLAVRGSSLKRALPDILMDLPLDELKQRCLEQLEIMSKKRIRRILEGANPADISSSGTEDSSAEDKAESVELESLGTGEEIVEEIEYIEVEEEVEVTDDEEEASLTKDAQSGEETEEENIPEGQSESEGQSDDENASDDETLAKTEEEEISDSGTVEEKTEDMNSQGQPKVAIAPILTKDQMEILELEMRARAIKAMLNKQPKAVSVNPADSAENKPVEVYNKTNTTDGTKGKEVDTKPLYAEDQAVRIEKATTETKKKSKRKQSKNMKAANKAREKGKILDAVKPDSIIADDATDQKSPNVASLPAPILTGVSTTEQKCQTSQVNEPTGSGITSRLNDAESCQQIKEGHSSMTMDSQCPEQTKDTLPGTNPKEVESCTESKESTNNKNKEVKFSEGTSTSHEGVLKKDDSQNNHVKVSGGLPDVKPIISENTPVDSSDTEEGEVTSGEDDN